MTLEEIINKYEVLEAQTLYNKAVELLQLISDEELEEIFSEYPKLFSKITNVNMTHEQLLKDTQSIKEAINIFIEVLESHNLSKDEFEVMTLDELKDYIANIITDKHSALLEIINKLEEIYK